MNEPTPWRQTWQFNLTTAALLTFVVGSLSWVNFGFARSRTTELGGSGFSEVHPICAERRDSFGWPFIMFEKAETVAVLKQITIEDRVEYLNYSKSAMMLNVLTAVLIALTCCFLSEFLLRRREARKT